MHNSRRGAMILLVVGALAVVAANPAMPQAGPSSSSTNEHARAIHVLNRLALGPRPGEVEAVETMGVDRWVDAQLHPNKINDSALDQRLANYAAPFMTAQQLMFEFPPRPLIRQALEGRISAPSREPERAIWESEMAREEQRKQARSQPAMQTAQNHPGESQAQNMHPPPPPDDMMAPDGMMSPAASGDGLAAGANMDAASLIELPAQQRYEALLKTPPGSMQQFVRSLKPMQRMALVEGLSPAQRETVVALVSPRLVVVNETESVRLLRDIYSERQLQRVMTEFWLNHFNISARKSAIEPYYLPEFEREVIAPHALGKFEDLLDAVAESPAMLLYLDNQQSVGPDSQFAYRREHPRYGRFQAPAKSKKSTPGINENYGRELMELHTVGVNGGYTQQDVIEAAKVLTGWTVAPPQMGGGFVYAANRHEPGTKVVMGHKIKSGGQKEGLELLHILATSPSTAQFISRKLAIRFVSDDPPQALVDRMAKTFLSSDGDISAVLRAMIDSPEFWAAPDTGNKVKTPLDYVVSAVRATNADVSEPFRLVSELQVMGMPMSGTQEPNGYSMKNDAWASSSELVNRMNFALALATNRIPGVAVSTEDLLGQDGSAMTDIQREARLEKLVLNGNASRDVHQAVVSSLSDAALQTRAAAAVVLAGDRGGSPFAAGIRRKRQEPANQRDSVVLGLLIGSPDFQRR